MNKRLALCTLFTSLAAAAGLASADTTVIDPPTATVVVAPGGGAGGSGGLARNSVGVGVEYILGGVPLVSGAGLGGISANYNTDKFHVGGFFAFNDPDGKDNTAFAVGGRFFFHLHHTASADFSIGGSVGIANQETGPDKSITPIVIEPGFQVRWFATPNFALSFIGGVSIGVTSDDKDFSIGGPSGIVGFHYYFTK